MKQMPSFKTAIPVLLGLAAWLSLPIAWADKPQAAAPSATIVFGDSFTKSLAVPLDQARHEHALEVGSLPKELRLADGAAQVRVRQYVGLAASSGGQWADRLAPVAATGWNEIRCTDGTCQLPVDLQRFPAFDTSAQPTLEEALKALRGVRLEWFAPHSSMALDECRSPAKMGGRTCYVYNSGLEIMVQRRQATTLIALRREGGP